MHSPLARSLPLVTAILLAAFAFAPASLEAQAAQPAPRPTAARAAAQPAPLPKVGQCAYNRRNDRLVGRVLDIGPTDVDASGRKAPGQRVVEVELPNGIDIRVTYPRNLKVRDCQAVTR